MVKVIKGIPAGWGECSRTTQVNGSTGILSHHNNNIAIGCRFGGIMILNAVTGSQSAVLSEYGVRVHCVAFSSDGTSLVSGCGGNTVKLWDVQTGGVVKTFFGHQKEVTSVSISADCTTIASGSEDHTICLWDIKTGGSCHTIKQEDTVYHVVFSPTDPQHFISISGGKVRQWDANGCQIRPPFDGYNVVFSSDGAQVVSYFKQTVTVHNSSSGAIVSEFQAADHIYWCSFSPDNRLIAVAAHSIAYCWDITTPEPQLVKTFIGHTEWISSLVFSSSSTLISASYEGSVKFWQIGTQSTDPAIINLEPISLPSASIEFITLQSKEGIAITHDSGGVVKAWDISTGICRASSQTPAKHVDKRDAQLIDGRLILVWDKDEVIHVWDGENEKPLWTVSGPGRAVGLRISGDGSRVFALGVDSIWARSLQTGEVVGKVEIKEPGISASLIVDGSKVWVYQSQGYKGWDFSISGSIPMELSNTPTLPSPSRFWDAHKARIKDPVTGEIIFQLSGRFEKPVCIQCDDSCLVVGYKSGEVLIFDLTNVK